MTLEDDRIGFTREATGIVRGPRAVVAVPVRNEAERIGACLAALAAQQHIDASDLGARSGTISQVNAA